MKPIVFLAIAIFIFIDLPAQEVIQTIRGTVRDKDSRSVLPGANIIIMDAEPFTGTSTNEEGKFVLDNIPVGRVSLKISFLGYEERVIPNIIVGGGKQVVLDIELSESFVRLDEAVISARKNKAEVLNEMALSSARTFSVEETKRYAGSFNDPARMVSSFAGVTGNPEGNNDIVVRGNSSKGILWRLEGIEIPNPNHFSYEGSTGGPINALNSSMLANSDFFTGAFAPEYGNAMSGVFDMKLRTGNNQKREYSVSGGIIGLDATLEGPFTGKGNSSYLANYRYSSLGILDDLNFIHYQGIPKYQDGSFKFHFPTKKLGALTVFGLGGMSNIAQSMIDDETNEVHWVSDYKSNLGVVGFNQIMPVNHNSYFINNLSVSTNGNKSEFEGMVDGVFQSRYTEDMQNHTYRLSSAYNAKINNRNSLKSGATYSLQQFNFYTKVYSMNLGRHITLLDDTGEAGLLQAYTSWKHRLTEKFTFTGGLHYMHFMLNNAKSIEPRAGFKWQFSEKQAFTGGMGFHSKLEPLTVYFVTRNNADSYFKPNSDLELGKARHFVLGYENLLNSNLLFKMEVYYQQLDNIPVENHLGSSFSMINSSGWFTDIDLVNKGKGKNYGLELTLERYFHKGYFFLLTSSLYESKYTALDQVWRNTGFNGNYAGNLLFGREMLVGDLLKNRTLGLTAKITLAGGQRYTPLDLEQSIEKGHGIHDNENAYTAQADDLFMANMVIYYRKERPKITHELRIDVQNLTNSSARLYEYYDWKNQSIGYGRQLPIIPSIIYKIDF